MPSVRNAALTKQWQVQMKIADISCTQIRVAKINLQ